MGVDLEADADALSRNRREIGRNRGRRFGSAPRGPRMQASVRLQRAWSTGMRAGQRLSSPMLTSVMPRTAAHLRCWAAGDLSDVYVRCRQDGTLCKPFQVPVERMRNPASPDVPAHLWHARRLPPQTAGPLPCGMSAGPAKPVGFPYADRARHASNCLPPGKGRAHGWQLSGNGNRHPDRGAERAGPRLFRASGAFLDDALTEDLARSAAARRPG